ncbi:hypothetical protein QNE37_003681 [Vibrio vulnificus]|nr:hypothetical protein [Vibrio vulnificus]ELV8803975.1 hypothetical protein [Vibrio vulnificus]
MILKMHTVSAEVSAKHPGSAGIEPHAFTEKDAKTTVHRDWFWPLKAMVKLVLFLCCCLLCPAQFRS